MRPFGSISRSVVAAILVATSLAACSDDTPTEATATLTILAGTVEHADGSGAFHPAVDGASLIAGDTVRTGPDGRAEITYFDSSITRLDFATTFHITFLEVDDDGTTTISAEQLTGNSYSRVVELINARSRFDIETPTAVAGVQGTEYAVLIDPEDGKTTVVVIDRSVRVTAESGDTVVEAGFSVVVPRPGVSTGDTLEPTPTAPEVLGSDWIVFNQPGA